MTLPFETRSIVQLGRAVAVPEGAVVPLQVEGSPAVSVPVEALFGKYLSVAVSYETAAELLADLDHDANAIGLVYSDPDPINSIYWFKVGAAGTGSWQKTNIAAGQAGPSGPANSTFATTAELEEAPVGNVSAILAEAAKSGTFIVRDYADYVDEVAVDTGKVNYIRSTSTPIKVWVRTSILPSAAAQVGTADNNTVEDELSAKALALGIGKTAASMGVTAGTILSDDAPAKVWFEELEAAAEESSEALAAAETALGQKIMAEAIGIGGSDSDMGLTSGTILSDNGTAKEWFALLENVAEAVKAVVGIYFKSKWEGTEAELLALIDSDPVAADAFDDRADFYAAWTNAVTRGFPLVVNSVVYINSVGSITVDGKRVELIGHATGTIVGGPDLDDRMIRAINSSTSGGTAARSVDVVVRNLRTNLQKAPQGTLNSVNHYNFSGFRRTIIDSSTLWSGAHYSTAGGDAGIFSTSNRVIVRDCNFHGLVDLGIYQSGSADGTLDNCNAVFIGNSYYNCANAWAAKRNYQHVRSVGEYFEGCYNGPAALAATGTGDGTLPGSRVSVVAPTFKNMANRCIDPRGSSDWNVSGMVVSGTFGKDYTGSDVAGAAIFCVSGSVRCRGDFVANVVSTGADHAAVRFQASGSTQATDNVIACTVSGIANGVIETGSSNRNRVTIDADATVTTLFTLAGAESEVRWNRSGVRGLQIGGYDRLEGRTPFTGLLRTSSQTLTLASVGQTERFETSGSNINCVLPSGATNGDRLTIYKTAASGSGMVLVRNPANTSTLARLLDANTQITMVYNGQSDAWVTASRTTSDSSMALLAVAPAAVPTPPPGVRTLFVDASDNALKVKDSNGSLSSVVQLSRKTADEVINNSATLQDDEELKYAIAANEKTNFRITIAYAGSLSADLKIAIKAPTGATVRWSPVSGIYVDSALTAAVTAEIQGIGTTLVLGSDGSNRHITIEGRVDNGGTAGEVVLQWAQNVAEANNMTVRANQSYVEVYRQ